jgi:hypothetical protein
MATDEEKLAQEWEELTRLQREFEEQKISDRASQHKQEIEAKKKMEEDLVREKLAEEEKVLITALIKTR